MKTSSQLVSFVARGYDVVVERKGGERTIRVVNSRGAERASVTLHADAYEAFMLDAVTQIAADRQLSIQTKRDFYGGTWVEVRSGLFGQNLARLRISPRHIQMLQAEIAAQTRATPLAG